MSKKWDITVGEVRDMKDVLRTNLGRLRNLLHRLSVVEAIDASDEQEQKHKDFLQVFQTYIDTLEESTRTWELYPVIQQSPEMRTTWDTYHIYLKNNLAASKKYMGQTWQDFTSLRPLADEIDDAASRLYSRVGTHGLQSMLSVANMLSMVDTVIDPFYYIGEDYPAPDMAHLPSTRTLYLSELLNNPTLFMLNLILAKQNKIELMLDVLFNAKPELRKQYQLKREDVNLRVRERVKREETADGSRLDR